MANARVRHAGEAQGRYVDECMQDKQFVPGLRLGSICKRRRDWCGNSIALRALGMPKDVAWPGPEAIISFRAFLFSVWY
jgi:hypothetical protein